MLYFSSEWKTTKNYSLENYLVFFFTVIFLCSTVFPWVLKYHCQLIHGKFSDVSEDIVFQVRGLLPTPVYNISRDFFFFPDQKVNLCVILKFLQRKGEDYKPYWFKLDLALSACCLPTTLQTLIDWLSQYLWVLPDLISWQSSLAERLNDLTEGWEENQW